jgi:hypothetical protein
MHSRRVIIMSLLPRVGVESALEVERCGVLRTKRVPCSIITG